VSGTAERVGAIQAGQALFDSRGVSRIKITRQGQAACLDLPIRSTGLWELMEQLARQAPRPPARAEWVQADSDLGRHLGLNRDRPVVVFDTTDPDYLARLAEHHREVLWRVLIAGLDLPILEESGQPAAGLARQREILQASGLTEHHAGKIFKDLQALTKLEEEMEDFTSARP
jgi:hypothetical protein